MIDESARTWKKWVLGKRCFLGESGVGRRPLPGDSEGLGSLYVRCWWPAVRAQGCPMFTGWFNACVGDTMQSARRQRGETNGRLSAGLVGGPLKLS